MEGVHLRSTGSLKQIITQAETLHLSLFQCFTRPDGKQRLDFNQEEVEEFKTTMLKSSRTIFVHAPYWISLASSQIDATYRNLTIELERARNFCAHGMVLHIGAASGFQDRTDGIRAAARILNKAFLHHPDIMLIIENSAHSGNSMGGDLTELAHIRNELHQPEKISFCIDTGHAHAFGYNLSSKSEVSAFCDTIETILGTNQIALLHINNVADDSGSKLDRHTLLWNGTIPLDSLEQFCTDQRFATVPRINEPPVCTLQEAEQTVKLLKSWKDSQQRKD